MNWKYEFWGWEQEKLARSNRANRGDETGAFRTKVKIQQTLKNDQGGKRPLKEARAVVRAKNPTVEKGKRGGGMTYASDASPSLCNCKYIATFDAILFAPFSTDNSTLVS